MDVWAKGGCLSTIGPFTIRKGGFSQATFSQGDTVFSEFVSTNKQLLRKDNFYLLYSVEFVNN